MLEYNKDYIFFVQLCVIREYCLRAGIIIITLLLLLCLQGWKLVFACVCVCVCVTCDNRNNRHPYVIQN
jgi:hypothetical protein